jgi:uncharacterized protein (DUF1697 family)
LARYVALLRGINLGKQNRVSMPKLREMHVDLGYDDVATHLQSGNAVFTAPAGTSTTTLAKQIENRIKKDLDLDVAVLVVTSKQLDTIVENNSLAKPGRDPAKLMVAFLSKNVPAERLRDLDPDQFAPDEFATGPRVIYHWLPKGSQASKLPAALTDKKLGVTVTVRNWRTVTKLAALAAG